MRNRHIPLLCRRCKGPLARQEARCWHCGAERPPDPGLPTPMLRVIEGGGSAPERWPDEAGSSPAELPPVAAGSRTAGRRDPPVI